MVFMLELTYSGIEYILDVKIIDVKSAGYTFPPRVYETIDINSMLKTLLQDEVKASITIDVNRLKSNITINKTIRFAEKSFFLYHTNIHSFTFESFRRYSKSYSNKTRNLQKLKTY